VALPDWVFAIRPGINQDYLSPSFRLYASSPAVPDVPLQLDLATGNLSQLSTSPSQQPHPQSHPQHGHPRNLQQTSNSRSLLPALACERLWAPAGDGVQVPVTLLHQPGLTPFNGQQPLLVEVYGAYGQVLEADYKLHRLPLLQRGWSVALAHVRGGGELGRR
jgi:protease II